MNSDRLVKIEFETPVNISVTAEGNTTNYLYKGSTGYEINNGYLFIKYKDIIFATFNADKWISISVKD